MPLINIKNLRFGYDGSDKILFDDITLGIDTSWKLALAGRNGRGKTTFFKLLQGKLPYEGTITGVPPTVTFPSEDDEIECEEWRIRKELNRLGADPDIMYRPMETLSGGERTKLMLARLFSSDGIYPLIDEPTNHLDRQGRELVADYLRSKDGFILISHDRNFLDSCTDHTLVITKTGMELTQSDFSTWWDNNEQRMEGEKLMSLAKNLENRNEKKIKEKQSLLQDLEKTETLKIEGGDHHSATPVRLKDVSLKRYGEVITEHIDLTVDKGSKNSLQGPNGCGKSTLIKYLAGEDNDGIEAEGDIYIAQGLKISYVSQDTSFLRGDLYDLAVERGVDRTQLSTILIKMGFTKEMLRRDLTSFSLGQKKCVLIAMSLCQKADLYLWDEPLNYIDVYMRKEIERLVKESPITLLFVEHDRAFEDEVADTTVLL